MIKSNPAARLANDLACFAQTVRAVGVDDLAGTIRAWHARSIYERGVPLALWYRLQAIVCRVPVDYGGGGGIEKACVLSSVILEHHIERVVEIGVYRGRSLLPMAAALHYAGSGEIVGVDPWSAADAQQNDLANFPAAAAGVNEFVNSLDWSGIWREVLERIAQFGLGSCCRLLRTTSHEAAGEFPDHSIGMVHIDGNHDTEAVCGDVNVWVPKLVPGGFLVMDDATWSSVRVAMAEIEKSATRIFQFVGRANDFAIFQFG